MVRLSGHQEMFGAFAAALTDANNPVRFDDGFAPLMVKPKKTAHSLEIRGPGSQHRFYPPSTYNISL